MRHYIDNAWLSIFEKIGVALVDEVGCRKYGQFRALGLFLWLAGQFFFALFIGFLLIKVKCARFWNIVRVLLRITMLNIAVIDKIMLENNNGQFYRMVEGLK